MAAKIIFSERTEIENKKANCDKKIPSQAINSIILPKEPTNFAWIDKHAKFFSNVRNVQPNQKEEDRRLTYASLLAVDQMISKCEKNFTSKTTNSGQNKEAPKNDQITMSEKMDFSTSINNDDEWKTTDQSRSHNQSLITPQKRGKPFLNSAQCLRTKEAQIPNFTNLLIKNLNNLVTSYNPNFTKIDNMCQKTSKKDDETFIEDISYML